MKKSILLVLVLFLSGSIYSQIDKNSKQDIQRMKANLEFLASDALEGREAATKIENITSQFLVSEMKKIGLKSFTEDGSFLQRIPVKVSRIESGSEVKWYDENGNENLLAKGDDWVTQPFAFNDSLMKQKAEIVFCGYGITAEEYNYDDYKDIDVEGKILLLIWGEPESTDTSFFMGPKPTKYYGPTFKSQLAESKGAIGIIYIPDALMNTYWIYMKRMVMISTVQLKESVQDYHGNALPGILVSPEVGKILLNNEKYSLAEIEELLKEQKQESFELHKSASIFVNAKSWDDEIENVIGVIEGSDPELKNEFITIGAHYDHDGIWDGVVYNGADDNASGTIAVFETMRRLKNDGVKHSVIGILFSGEEKGLLGSQYFVSNYPEPEKLLVNINIDMCGREDVDSLTSKASEETSTELFTLVKSVDTDMEEIGFYYEPGINSPMGTSDHASFANAGIPAVYFGDKMRVDLHLPSDDADKINYQKILNTTHVIEKLVEKIDELDHPLSRDH